MAKHYDVTAELAEALILVKRNADQEAVEKLESVIENIAVKEMESAAERGDLVRSEDLDDYVKKGDEQDVKKMLEEHEVVVQSDLPDLDDYLRVNDVDEMIREKGLADEDELEKYLEIEGLGEGLREMDPKEFYDAMDQHGMVQLRHLEEYAKKADLDDLVRKAQVRETVKTMDALHQRGWRGLVSRVKFILTGSV
jgi:hypothetical protein